MDEKRDRPPGAYEYRTRPRTKIEDVIRSVKECTEEIERLVLKNGKHLPRKPTHHW